jgi:hypothetical protein
MLALGKRLTINPIGLIHINTLIPAAVSRKKIIGSHGGRVMATATPNVIVPRWEWRTFAASLKSADDKTGTLARVAPRESSEIYFINLSGSQNAKIRDDTFDVKCLQKVDADGLELWRPVFKAKFPLSRADVTAAFAHWSLAAPQLEREGYAVDQFIDELIASQPTLRIARVTKSRRGFNYQGCIAELVKLTVESLSLESFSLEHEEPSRIVNALGSLGLDSRTNTNYQVGLNRALGLKPAHATT